MNLNLTSQDSLVSFARLQNGGLSNCDTTSVGDPEHDPQVSPSDLDPDLNFIVDI
jgi:hypothetical protein